MGKSLTRKIIESHYVSGSMTPGEEVFIKRTGHCHSEQQEQSAERSGVTFYATAQIQNLFHINNFTNVVIDKP